MLTITLSYNGLKIKSECQPYKLIGDFIEILTTTMKLPKDQVFGIFMNGFELQKDKTLSQNNVKSGCILELQFTKTFEYIFLKVVRQQKSIFSYLCLGEKVQKLYDQTEKELNVPNGSFTLYFQGVALDRNKQLEEYKLSQNSIINCEDGQIIKQEIQEITVKIQFKNQDYDIALNQESLVSDLELKIKKKFQNIEFQLLKDGVQEIQSNQKINTLNANYILVSEKNQMEKQTFQIQLDYLGVTTYIPIKLDTVIQDLITMVKESYNINENIILEHNRQILPKDSIIGQLNIQEGSIVKVSSQRSTSKIFLNGEIKQIQLIQNDDKSFEKLLALEVFIKNKTLNITISENTLVQDIEKQIMADFNVRTGIKLFYNNQTLNSNQTLTEQIVKDIYEKKIKSIMPLQKIEISLNFYYKGNPPFTVTFPEDTTIKQIKDFINQQNKFNRNLEILQDEIVLDSSKTLKQLSIIDNTNLYLKQKTINLLIQTQDLTIELDVLEDTLTEQLYDDLAKIQKIPPPFIIQTEYGTQLTSNQTLMQQGLFDCCVLFIVPTNQEQIPQVPQIQQVPQISQFSQIQQIPQISQVPQIQSIPQIPQVPQSISIVIDMNGQRSTKEVLQDILVSQIQNELKQTLKINEQFNLMLQGKQILEPNLTLLAQNVSNGSILYISPIQIQVKEITIVLNFEQQKEIMYVKDNLKVNELIKYIQSTFYLKEEFQLRLEGQVILNDELTLAEQKVQSGNNLQAVFNGRSQNNQNQVFNEINQNPPFNQRSTNPGFNYIQNNQNPVFFQNNQNNSFNQRSTNPGFNYIQNKQNPVFFQNNQNNSFNQRSTNPGLKYIQNNQNPLFNQINQNPLIHQNNQNPLFNQRNTQPVFNQNNQKSNPYFFPQLNLTIQVLGNNLQLEIDQEIMVSQLIEHLRSSQNINEPAELWYNQRQLELNKSLKEQNVQNNSDLILKNIVSRYLIKVIDEVNNPYIEIAPSANVEELERKYIEIGGQGNYKCLFQFNGMILNSLSSLIQQGIIQNSEVKLIRKIN